MALFYYAPQGTVNVYMKNTVAHKIYVDVPSALHCVDVVFVAVRTLFAKQTFSADVDKVQR